MYEYCINFQAARQSMTKYVLFALDSVLSPPSCRLQHTHDERAIKVPPSPWHSKHLSRRQSSLAQAIVLMYGIYYFRRGALHIFYRFFADALSLLWNQRHAHGETLMNVVAAIVFPDFSERFSYQFCRSFN